MRGKRVRFPALMRYLLVGVLLGGLGLAGCGDGSRESLQREQSTLKPLAVLYGQYIGQHRGQPPAHEEAFRKFVQEQPAEVLKSLNVSSIEELFVSPRDGKPYKVLYGEAAKKAPSGGPAGAPVIAYEQEGRGGRRWVASAMGAIEEVDETRFKQLVPAGP